MEKILLFLILSFMPFILIIPEPVLAYNTVEDIAEQDDNFGSSLATGDFNGDGFVDLVVGVPGEDITINGQIVTDAGAANVIYGHQGSGLTATGNQFWSQNSLGILDYGEELDSFGFSLTTGDFNGNSVADLAIGVPMEGIDPPDYAGAANVIYGVQGSGLTDTGNQFWSQNSPGMLNVFGSSLATGDFNGDGVDDLAIGVPGETLGSATYAGAVNVIYGHQGSGLTATGNQFWTQDSGGIIGDVDANNYFGSSLAAGDFNRDGVDDLAIGVPGEGKDLGSIDGAGAVNVIYGHQGSGLTATGNQFWSQNSLGILDDPEPIEYFGSSLAAGDFNRDGVDDLAIGVPGETLGNLTNAGAVNVIYGYSGIGLNSTGNQLWHQNSPGILDDAEQDDNFGSSLATGDFNNDNADDLAIGVPSEDVEVTSVGNVGDTGAVNVIYGAQGLGLSAVGNQEWHQDAPGIEGTVGESNYFGSSLAAGDFNNDNADDLAIGVRGEDLKFSSTSSIIEQAGAVNVIYGAQGFGLSAVGSQIWSQGPGP